MNKTLSNILFLFIFLTTMQNKMCFSADLKAKEVADIVEGWEIVEPSEGEKKSRKL